MQIKPFLDWMKTHPRLTLAAGTGAAGAVFGGSRAAAQDKGQNRSPSQRVMHVLGAGLLTGLGGAAAGAIAGSAISNRAFLKNQAVSKGKFLGKYFGEAGEGYRYLRSEEALRQGYGAKNELGQLEKFSRTQAIGKVLYSRPGILIGGGAVAGAVIGGVKADDPLKGALIGAGAGVAGVAALGFHNLWGRMNGPMKAGAYMTMGAATFAGGLTMAGDGASMESAASPDRVGDYSYSDLHDRLGLMQATGDIVLGLNGSRHG